MFVEVCVCVRALCVHLQLLVLQQADHQRPDLVHRALVAHEGEQVVEDHDLQVREHRVAGVPGAAAGDLPMQRERERGRKRQRETERETETERARARENTRERERERERERDLRQR